MTPKQVVFGPVGESVVIWNKKGEPRVTKSAGHGLLRLLLNPIEQKLTRAHFSDSYRPISKSYMPFIRSGLLEYERRPGGLTPALYRRSARGIWFRSIWEALNTIHQAEDLHLLNLWVAERGAVSQEMLTDPYIGALRGRHGPNPSQPYMNALCSKLHDFCKIIQDIVSLLQRAHRRDMQRWRAREGGVAWTGEAHLPPPPLDYTTFKMVVLNPCEAQTWENVLKLMSSSFPDAVCRNIFSLAGFFRMVAHSTAYTLPGGFFEPAPGNRIFTLIWKR